MRTRSVMAFAIGIALSLLGGVRVSAQEAGLAFERWLPAGTLVLVEVPDARAALAALNETDLFKVAAHLEPFVREVLAIDPETRARIEAEIGRGLGIPPAHLLAAVRRGAAIALIDADGPEPALAIAIDGRGDAGEGVKPLAEEAKARGLEVFDRHGVLVIATPGPHVEEIRKRSSGAAGAGADLGDLGSEPTFRAVAKALASPPGARGSEPGVVPLVTAFVNVRHLVESAGGEGSPPAKILPGTRAAGLAIGADRKAGKVDVVLTVQGGTESGALGLLPRTAVDRDTVLRLAGPDATGVAAVRLDLGAALDRAIGLADSLEPGARERAEKEILDAEARLGVSIRGELVGALGDDWVSVSFDGDAGFPSSVLSVSLRDAEKFERAFEKTVAAGGIEVRRTPSGVRYLLTPLGRLGAAPPDPASFAAGFALNAIGSAYEIREGRLFVADLPATLEVFRERRAAAATAGAETEIARAIAAVPAGASMLSWQEGHRVFPQVYVGMTKLVHFLEPYARALGIPVNAALLPRAATVAAGVRPGDLAGTSWLVADDKGQSFTFEWRPGGPSGTLSAPAAIAGVGVMAAFLTPVITKARQEGFKTACKSNLRQLAMASLMYADNPPPGTFKKGMLPWPKPLRPGDNRLADPAERLDAMELLYRHDFIDDPKVYVCPADARADPAEPIEDLAERKSSFELDEHTCSYDRTPKLLDVNAGSRTPVYWDRAGNHRDGRHVAFMGGNVELMDEDAFQALMKKHGIDAP